MVKNDAFLYIKKPPTMVPGEQYEFETTVEDQYEFEMGRYNEGEVERQKQLERYQESANVPYFEDVKAVNEWHGRLGGSPWVLAPAPPGYPHRPNLAVIQDRHERRRLIEEDRQWAENAEAEAKKVQEAQHAPYVELKEQSHTMQQKEQPVRRGLPVVYRRGVGGAAAVPVSVGLSGPLPPQWARVPQARLPQPPRVDNWAAPGAARTRAAVGGAIGAIYGAVTGRPYLSIGIGAAALASGYALIASRQSSSDTAPKTREQVLDRSANEIVSTGTADHSTGGMFTITPIELPEGMRATYDQGAERRRVHRPRARLTPLAMLVGQITNPMEWTKMRKYKVRLAKVTEPRSNFKYLAKIKKVHNKKRKK